MAQAAAVATKPHHQEKPEMAGKKVWKFEIVKGKEEDIPVTVRTGGVGLPFEFTGMEVGDHFPVPVEFWVDRGIDKTKITPTLNNDRIRRSFYNWQAKPKDDKKELARRAALQLAFSNQFTKDKYSGVEVYLANKRS